MRLWEIPLKLISDFDKSAARTKDTSQSRGGRRANTLFLPDFVGGGRFFVCSVLLGVGWKGALLHGGVRLGVVSLILMNLFSLCIILLGGMCFFKLSLFIQYCVNSYNF